MYVVGTAGHVDHGKSTLITALTGMDPDRLAEEKRRGMTIDLGFAWTTLPSGTEVGFVDVPGHHRFVRNMLAGVASVDSVIFVVAADDGWSAQSEEHFEILELLGVRSGLVALTKVDLVDADRRAAVREDIRARVGEKWQVVEVAASQGLGIETLRQALDDRLALTPPAPDAGRPRLWVDRSFTIAGAGTVVTGTLLGGRFRVDDTVQVEPGGHRCRIRAVHTHRRARPTAEPGSRTALNLVGVDAGAVRRGDAVVAPDSWQVTSTVDVHVTSPPGRTVERREYTMHVGTARTSARVLRIDDAFARVRLARALPLAPGDLFVLRDEGEERTAGGGRVLDVEPVGPVDPERLARRLAPPPGTTLADVLLEERGIVTAGDLPRLTGASRLPTSGTEIGGYLVSERALEELAARAQAEVAQYQRDHPQEPGMPKELLRTRMVVPVALLQAVLARTPLIGDADLVRGAEHDVDTSGLESLLASYGLAPPPIDELGVPTRLLHRLARDGEVVMAGRFAYRRDDFERACRIVRSAIDASGPQTVSELRVALGVTRRHAVPLLEAMDAARITRRSGLVRS